MASSNVGVILGWHVGKNVVRADSITGVWVWIKVSNGDSDVMGSVFFVISMGLMRYLWERGFDIFHRVGSFCCQVFGSSLGWISQILGLFHSFVPHD